VDNVFFPLFHVQAEHVFIHTDVGIVSLLSDWELDLISFEGLMND
jgi:hypothetical protein